MLKSVQSFLQLNPIRIVVLQNVIFPNVCLTGSPEFAETFRAQLLCQKYGATVKLLRSNVNNEEKSKT